MDKKDYAADLLRICKEAELSAEDTIKYLCRKYNDSLELMRQLLEKEMPQSFRNDSLPDNLDGSIPHI